MFRIYSAPPSAPVKRPDSLKSPKKRVARLQGGGKGSGPRPGQQNRLGTGRRSGTERRGPTFTMSPGGERRAAGFDRRTADIRRAHDQKQNIDRHIARVEKRAHGAYERAKPKREFQRVYSTLKRERMLKRLATIKARPRKPKRAPRPSALEYVYAI